MKISCIFQLILGVYHLFQFIPNTTFINNIFNIIIIILCFLTLIVAAFSVLLVHGCSFSEYDLVVEDSSGMVLEEANSTRALSEQNCRNDLVISVSESEEYLDYLMSLHMFFDKFDSYYLQQNIIY